MRSTLLWLMAWILCAGVALAEPVRVEVRCDAITLDDNDSHSTSSFDRPHPVVLMVAGKLQGRAGDWRVAIDQVLFGSPPADKIIRVKSVHYDRHEADTEPHIYGLVGQHERDQDKPYYGTDDTRFHDRRVLIAELPAMRAVAAARLDAFVLSRDNVFVGKPIDGKMDRTVRIRVERSLHGNYKPGDEIEVSAREQQAIPLAAAESYLYFVDQPDEERQPLEVVTRWAATEADTVRAALARRVSYPLSEIRKAYGGELERDLHVILRGSRREALALLASKSRAAQRLGMDRLLHDGAPAIKEVAAAIEAQLLLEKSDARNEFKYQANLIEVLSELEQNKANGETSRLIDVLLAKVEAGATFPVKPRDDKVRHFSDERYGLEPGENHSLAWLLLSLDEAVAAERFGARLLKLRDLAQYGWKDEVQLVLDRAHLEDHLEMTPLKKVKVAPPRRQRLERGHDGEITRIQFANEDAEFVTTDAAGTVCQWDSASGKLVKRREVAAPERPRDFGRRRETSFTASDGQIWSFVGESPYYGSPAAYLIYVTKPGQAIPRSVQAADRKRAFGVIEPKFESSDLGLVPGNNYLHIGTQVYARKDLRLVSAANVPDLDLVVFSPDGQRYAIFASESSRPKRRIQPILGEAFESYLTGYRLRVHETATGKTLWTSPYDSVVTCLALSDDGKKIAVVSKDQELSVWTIE